MKRTLAVCIAAATLTLGAAFAQDKMDKMGKMDQTSKMDSTAKKKKSKKKSEKMDKMDKTGGKMDKQTDKMSH